MNRHPAHLRPAFALLCAQAGLITLCGPLSSVAEAYCLSTAGGGNTCAAPDPSAAVPLAWTVPRVELSINYESCSNIDPAVLRLAVIRSMNTWMLAGDGCTSVAFGLGPDSLELATNLDNTAFDSINRIRCRQDSWPQDVPGSPASPAGLVTFTSVRHDPVTGQILDADIDLNLVDYNWGVLDPANPDTGLVDIENALTHELGHLLGFAHSQAPEATMFAASIPGETEKRTLADDDILASCEHYPFVFQRAGPAVQSLTVSGELGCRVARSNASAFSHFFPILGCLIWRLRRRRKRASAIA